MGWGCFGDLEGEADDVEGPEVEVAHGFPEEFGGDGLAVVHAGFCGVFADDAVDDYGFLSATVISYHVQVAWENGHTVQ